MLYLLCCSLLFFQCYISYFKFELPFRNLCISCNTQSVFIAIYKKKCMNNIERYSAWKPSTNFLRPTLFSTIYCRLLIIIHFVTKIINTITRSFSKASGNCFALVSACSSASEGSFQSKSIGVSKITRLAYLCNGNNQCTYPPTAAYIATSLSPWHGDLEYKLICAGIT